MLQFGLDSRLLRMACIDVQPTRPNSQTVMLLHSNNFGADKRINILQALSARIIALSQQKNRLWPSLLATGTDLIALRLCDFPALGKAA